MTEFHLVKLEAIEQIIADAAAASAAITAPDAIATAADRVQTGLDRTSTGLDKTATAADRVQTGLDRTSTGLDKTATAADRVQTGLDRAAMASITPASIGAATAAQGTDARTPTAHAVSHNAGGSDALTINAAAGTGSLRTLGTTATSACSGNDSRLSDARSPTAHAASHATGQSDALTAANIGAQAAMTSASRAEMETGTETTLRAMSPQRVAQAIDMRVPFHPFMLMGA